MATSLFCPGANHGQRLKNPNQLLIGNPYLRSSFSAVTRQNCREWPATDDLGEVLEWSNLDMQHQHSGMESDNTSCSSNFSGTNNHYQSTIAASSVSASAAFHFGAHPASQSCRNNCVQRFAFRMRSEKEIVDDGYRWRKYGKKQVKSSPNPRNYFKCLVRNCNVKKRVERDAHDNEIVITTYEGRHNHERPSVFLTMQEGNPMLFVDNRNNFVLQNHISPAPSNHPAKHF